MIWLIGLGGSFGAALRYFIGLQFQSRLKLKRPFPLHTWLINISGSFLLGVLAKLHLEHQLYDWVWYFAGVGFCGAFTTFSTFGFETVTLIQNRHIGLAIVYVSTSIILGVGAALLGYLI
ncbi:fluoride efflux transporter CrcB [Bacillus marasmi]|uniref:fluoride efflux transporter CrcB n=1 Tax=Bacillus marasmi TaxID=1926279 RepID=UPI0011CC0A63|nr:fluoride efflux transporter CrcB [Bacillus marasmi]